MPGLVESIETTRIVAVLRGVSPEEAVPLVEALWTGGVRVVEFPIASPVVLECIERVRDALPRALRVGAGTVLSAEGVRRAHAAGAEFVVTPVVEPAVIEAASEHRLPTVIGALTPTEIYTAYRSGAAAVKVFPANRFGPSYLREVKTPLPEIPLIPMGGIEASNALQYLEAGASAVGVGGWLTSRSLWGDGDFAPVIKRAKALRSALASTFTDRDAD